MSQKCKHCGQTVYGSTHTCPKTEETYSVRNDGSDFLISLAIGAATDSALLGGLLGGDMAGGIIGDMLDGDLFD